GQQRRDSVPRLLRRVARGVAAARCSGAAAYGASAAGGGGGDRGRGVRADMAARGNQRGMSVALGMGHGVASAELEERPGVASSGTGSGSSTRALRGAPDVRPCGSGAAVHGRTRPLKAIVEDALPFAAALEEGALPFAAGREDGVLPFVVTPEGRQARRRGWAGGRGRSRAVAPAAQQRGVAVITAMLVVAMGWVVAVILMWDATLDQRRTLAALASDQGLLYLQSAEAWAGDILRQDLVDSPDADHLGEEWAVELPPLPVEGGVIAGRLEDLQGRFNLNN